MPQDTIIQQYADFALKARFEDLPPDIVQETKMILMDAVGCALVASQTDKGKINLSLAKRFGGPPEASVIGCGFKVGLSTASLINGELMYTPDYISMIASGNEPSYVLPAILTMAENGGATGRELILSTAIGLEISTRLARATLRQVLDPKEVQAKPIPHHLKRHGNAYSNFGAAAGAGRILGLDRIQLAHALGIAGHLCIVMTHGRYGSAGQRWSLKYGAPGFQSMGALSAVFYAQMGYTGDLTQLDDPENGFWYMVGYKDWYPKHLTEELGRSWLYNFRMQYKPYPSCSVWHGLLDCFYEIIDNNNLTPDEIESVHAYAMVPMDHPLYGNKTLNNIEDAQFNARYLFSVAAHRVKIGIDWLDPETLRNPSIIKFMDKVSWEEYHTPSPRDPSVVPAKVEVKARGQTFYAEKDYPHGRSGTESAMTQDELADKFRHNALRVLTEGQIDRAIKLFTDLENVDNIQKVMKEVTK
ncbi:MAG: MmgE/PrpD family protein [Dehalococcoidales bacterium]|nr:MmgE/PrpD family protein [Dehalococcoidales bacterium]